MLNPATQENPSSSNTTLSRHYIVSQSVRLDDALREILTHVALDEYSKVAVMAPSFMVVRTIIIPRIFQLLNAFNDKIATARYHAGSMSFTFNNQAVLSFHSQESGDAIRGINTDLILAYNTEVWNHPESLDMLRFGNRLGACPKEIEVRNGRP